MATKDASGQAACPFHSKPEKQKEQSSQVECCKVLRAVVPTISKSWARSDGDFSDIHFPFEECRLFGHFGDTLAPLLLDTGPPGAHRLLIDLAAEPFRSRAAKRRLERSKRVLFVGQPLRLPFCRAGRRGACPTTRRNEKGNLGSNRERILAAHDHYGDRAALGS